MYIILASGFGWYKIRVQFLISFKFVFPFSLCVLFDIQSVSMHCEHEIEPEINSIAIAAASKYMCSNCYSTYIDIVNCE